MQHPKAQVIQEEELFAMILDKYLIIPDTPFQDGKKMLLKFETTSNAIHQGLKETVSLECLSQSSMNNFLSAHVKDAFYVYAKWFVSLLPSDTVFYLCTERIRNSLGIPPEEPETSIHYTVYISKHLRTEQYSFVSIAFEEGECESGPLCCAFWKSRHNPVHVENAQHLKCLCKKDQDAAAESEYLVAVSKYKDQEEMMEWMNLPSLCGIMYRMTIKKHPSFQAVLDSCPCPLTLIQGHLDLESLQGSNTLHPPTQQTIILDRTGNAYLQTLFLQEMEKKGFHTGISLPAAPTQMGLDLRRVKLCFKGSYEPPSYLCEYGPLLPLVQASYGADKFFVHSICFCHFETHSLSVKYYLPFLAKFHQQLGLKMVSRIKASGICSVLDFYLEDGKAMLSSMHCSAGLFSSFRNVLYFFFEPYIINKAVQAESFLLNNDSVSVVLVPTDLYCKTECTRTGTYSITDPTTFKMTFSLDSRLVQLWFYEGASYKSSSYACFFDLNKKIFDCRIKAFRDVLVQCYP
jgi:hypothetical protein